VRSNKTDVEAANGFDVAVSDNTRYSAKRACTDPEEREQTCYSWTVTTCLKGDIALVTLGAAEQRFTFCHTTIQVHAQANAAALLPAASG
jgi:hypothetical protein